MGRKEACPGDSTRPRGPSQTADPSSGPSGRHLPQISQPVCWAGLEPNPGGTYCGDQLSCEGSSRTESAIRSGEARLSNKEASLYPAYQDTARIVLTRNPPNIESPQPGNKSLREAYKTSFPQMVSPSTYVDVGIFTPLQRSIWVTLIINIYLKQSLVSAGRH